MNNQITYRKPSGLTSQGLRIWGLLFMAVGIVGRGIVQNELLGSSENMTVMTVALVMRIVQGCALPIFTFLLVEGIQKTTSVKFYFLRIAGVAVLAEIPFDLVNSGVFFNWHFQNPLWSMLLALVMLYLLRHFSEKTPKHIAINVVIILVAWLWTTLVFPTRSSNVNTIFAIGESKNMLPEGTPIILLTAALWYTRKKKAWQIYAGTIAIVLVSLVTPNMVYMPYMGAPLAFIAIHFYNEEQGDGNRVINYLAYPVILLAVALIAMFAI